MHVLSEIPEVPWDGFLLGIIQNGLKMIDRDVFYIPVTLDEKKMTLILSVA
jgi:hypothetical protein